MNLYLVQALEESFYVEASSLLQAVAIWQDETDCEDDPETIAVISDSPAIRAKVAHSWDDAVAAERQRCGSVAFQAVRETGGNTEFAEKIRRAITESA